jgi:predicted ATPase
LVEAELLYQRGRPPRARYIFKHALIQDAAYASLLKSTRHQVHQQIPQVLEARFPALVETQPELVAQHYTAAGCIEQAVRYWQQAGQQASERSANLEAVSHFTTRSILGRKTMGKGKSVNSSSWRLIPQRIRASSPSCP